VKEKKTINVCGREGDVCHCNGEVRYGVGYFSQREIRKDVNESIFCKLGHFMQNKKNLASLRNKAKNCLCKNKKRRVALCFWGVNRSLNRTIDSLKKFIVKPLQKANVDFDIFFHTYSLETIDSFWARERSALVEGAINEYQQLSKLGKIRRWEATEQTLFDHETNYSFFTKTQNIYPLGTMKNMIRSLNSLKRVTDLWLLEEEARGGAFLRKEITNLTTKLEKQQKMNGKEKRGFYDAIVYLRPDLEFLSPLNVSLLFSIGNRDLYTPIWSTYHGLNDRFAAGAPKAVLSFGHRLHHLQFFASLGNEVHSERFLAWAVQEHAQVKPVFSKEPCGIRMRTSGPSSYDCLRIESRFMHHPALKVQQWRSSGRNNPRKNKFSQKLGKIG